MGRAFGNLLFVIVALAGVWDAAAYTKVTVMAPAVAQTAEGWVGATSYITVSAEPGNGSVFVDTFPLTEIDTQGSARLAGQAAASLAGQNLAKIDLFIVIRSDSAVIGGPSAGGAMSVAILACLLNRTVNPGVVMTGTINPDGTIGPIGGVLQKAEAAHSVGARLFLVPMGQTIATESPDSLTVVNVTEYAQKNLELTVKEVDDLREAAKWMIGVEIKPPEGKEIDLTKYNDIMSKAAQDMLDSAVELADRAKSQFDSAALTFNQRNLLNAYVEDFAGKIDSAKDAQKAETYYLSASYSFQSKINSTYVLYALEYFGSKSNKETAKMIITEAEKSAAASAEDVNATAFTSITAFECYAAAQTRAHEALRMGSTAWELYYGSTQDQQVLQALAEAAYMTQRAESALWWVGLCSEFPGDVDVNRTVLKSTAQGYVDDLKFLLAYAESFSELASSGLLQSANDILQNVEDEPTAGAYAAAILEILRARSYVNAHLELASLASSSEDQLAEALTEKVGKERELTRSSIASSRDFGVNPILALSHLESGENYADKVDPKGAPSTQVDDLMQAYLELKYARLVAEMSPVISARLGVPQGENLPEIVPYNGTTGTVYRTKAQDAAAIAVASVAGGLIVGVLLGRRSGKVSRHGM